MLLALNMYFMFVCLFGVASAVVDYCELDKVNQSVTTPGIQFTKELSASEYAVSSSFKSLHCCAKGYRSIEWLKDGKPYPWSGDVSSFILYPESANQTIYSQAASPLDSGLYTCRVANDSRLVQHTQALNVFVKKHYMDIPLETYILPDEQFARIGQTTRLFCEAFVGKIDLPDATTEVWWERPGFNMSAPEGSRYRQQLVSRDEGQVVGAYLFIEKVKFIDFAEYICSISNTEDQVIRMSTILREEEWDTVQPSHKIPWLKLQFLLITVLAVTTLIFIYRRFAPTVFLYLKLKFSQPSINDGKENDVLICHSKEDTDFALQVLAAKLRNRYNYTVTLCQINNARASAELQLASTVSRRLLVVLTPSLVDSQWTPVTICPFLKQLFDIHSNIICVLQQELQADASWKCEEGVLLRQLLAKTSIISWQESAPSAAQQRRFWTTLRLSLPPPAIADPGKEMNTLPTVTRTRLSPLAKSNESLEVLV